MEREGTGNREEGRGEWEIKIYSEEVLVDFAIAREL